MEWLVDGYNLLHASGIVPTTGQGELQAARETLLRWLTTRLPADYRQRTTIVFDGRDAPPGLPDHYTVHGLQIRFARHQEADDLIEQLIQASHHPRQLTVVSNDRRLQRAARRRRGEGISCGTWLASLNNLAPDPPRTDLASDAAAPGDPIFSAEYLAELKQLEQDLRSPKPKPPRL